MKILGLDLGTNSIGWAIVDDEQKKILGTGVRIFPAGVENLGDGEGELSKNASRRMARGTRRQYFRRKLRRNMMKKVLRANAMCPANSPEYKDWINLNPYTFRSKALKTQISLLELGRVFYHMVQRRGFQSNSRSQDPQESSVIFDEDKTNEEKTGKPGIVSTREGIKSADSTLGDYLNSLLPTEGESYIRYSQRVRNRYVERSMYREEFDQIWAKQKKYYPEILTDDLRISIGGNKKIDGSDGILFFSRPLRSQKFLIGKCTFEPKKPRAPLSCIESEEARIYQLVNSFKNKGEFLSDDLRQKAVNVFLTQKRVTVKTLRKKLKIEGKTDNFNYDDEEYWILSHYLQPMQSNKFFGKAWSDITQKNKEELWHVLHSYDDKLKVEEWVLKNLPADKGLAKALADFHFKSEYNSLSRRALRRILPFLKRGFQFHEAVVLGGVVNALGKVRYEGLPSEAKSELEDNILGIVSRKEKGGYLEKIKEYLTLEFGSSETDLKKLYHHSVETTKIKVRDRLPVGPDADREITGIRNPVVIQAIFELRKVVNDLLNRFGKFDIIKVELARDLKSSKQRRNEILKKQRFQRRENDRVNQELEKLGEPTNYKNRLRYKLWEECERTCPYTGNTISVAQLFNCVQVEHILPYSKSLDDSFLNKTLCFTEENARKGNCSPYEFYSAQGEAKWQEVKNRAFSIFQSSAKFRDRYRKYERFIAEKYNDDFVSSQLNDTRYISKVAKNYLQGICHDITVSPGIITSELRHRWGLNNVIKYESEVKDRSDHRHHAIDALVMALTSQAVLHNLANQRFSGNRDDSFEKPWNGFREDAKRSIDQILVSYKQTNKVFVKRKYWSKKNNRVYVSTGVAARGPLHKESLYGKRTDPITQTTSFHMRKELSALTPAMIPKIVDSSIREIISQSLESAGIAIDSKSGKATVKGKAQEKVFQGVMNSSIFLPNKNGGDPVPIRKVRIKEESSSAIPLSKEENRWVNSASNHHIELFENEKGEMKERVVSFWEAVERKRQGIPLINKVYEDGWMFVTSLSKNEMFILLGESDVREVFESPTELASRLYRVQKISTKFYEFRKASEASLVNKKWPYYQYITSFGSGKTGWKAFNPVRVSISPSGILSKAND